MQWGSPVLPRCEADVKILIATSEAAPFAKTGGLADVCGALPSALSRLGHEVAVIMPGYRHALRSELAIEPTGIRFDVPIGSKIVSGELFRSQLPAATPVYLVGQDHYFDRPELYRQDGEDYQDNCERFVFFCRAVLEATRLLGFPPDIIHCHDWQTGLIPAYLKLEYFKTPGYERIGSLLTIHNMAYQGVFWHWDMLLTGIDWQYFNWNQMEYYGKLNLLKTGLVFADKLTTVSPQYAHEIQQHPLGFGLEGVLQNRSQDLHGIVNGVDYSIWDPATDPHLPRNYRIGDWPAGKKACKTALQDQLGLPLRSDVPLIGIIGRLASQKGWDLIEQLIQRWADTQDAQWVILGTGEPHYHETLAALERRFPDRVAARLCFDDALAHRIEAGADLFLMPSQFEPCGLNQLYSLKYGAVPIVHATGGLVDTIVHATPNAISQGVATGFQFSPFTLEAFEAALFEACNLYRQQPDQWARIVAAGMGADWSWGRSAARYVELYQTIANARR